MSFTCITTRIKNKDIDILSHIDNRFCELETRLTKTITGLVNNLLKVHNDAIKSLTDTVNSQDNAIKELKERVASLIDEIKDLETKVDLLNLSMINLEQYSRRISFRLDWIKKENNESTEKFLKLVKDCFKEANVTIPDSVLDRAHRIGPIYHDENNNQFQSILIKFTNFTYRTLFYRKRKSLKNGKMVRIDLVKSKYMLLKEARKLLKDENLNQVHIFSDINCRLKIVDIGWDEYKFIDTMDDVRNFLSTLFIFDFRFDEKRRR